LTALESNILFDGDSDKVELPPVDPRVRPSAAIDGVDLGVQGRALLGTIETFGENLARSAP